MIDWLAKFQQLFDRKLANPAANGVDMPRGPFRTAKERVEAGEGRDLMDAIRSEIAAAVSLEAANLARLERESEFIRRRAEAMIVTLLAGIAIVFIAMTLLLTHAVAGRRAAPAEARRAGEQEKAMFDSVVDGMLVLCREQHYRAKCA